MKNLRLSLDCFVAKSAPRNDVKMLGFSLLEMLIVLVIISIMTFMALPPLQRVTDLTHTTVLQSQLLHALQLAKQEALARRQPVTFCKSKDLLHCGGEWRDGLLIFIDRSGLAQVNRNADILAVMQLQVKSGQLYFRSFPHYRNFLRFLPDNWLSVDNATFWYCRNQQVLPDFVLAVSSKGITRVLPPNRQGIVKDSRGRIFQCQPQTTNTL